MTVATPMRLMTMAEDQLAGILDALSDLLGDGTVPRNIKSKIEDIMRTLNGADEISMRVNKALQQLDEISDDTNIQAYTRTQLWNVVSLLEMVR
ncbi:UPF0147 family protein [Candidatus Woesearchaeota archaeon]|nr:UPF0147 family protein [Candidatus Woesearchaeota archaeon]